MIRAHAARRSRLRQPPSRAGAEALPRRRRGAGAGGGGSAFGRRRPPPRALRCPLRRRRAGRHRRALPRLRPALEGPPQRALPRGGRSPGAGRWLPAPQHRCHRLPRARQARCPQAPHRGEHPRHPPPVLGARGRCGQRQGQDLRALRRGGARGGDRRPGPRPPRTGGLRRGSSVQGDMALQVYNTLTKRKEPFLPLVPGKVRMYNCGPTVYSFAHIGNFASFLLADLLRRHLEYSGCEVLQVMNITDVGHLTEDNVADARGEDKLEKKAREEKKNPFEIARFYEQAFHEDRVRLRLVPAHRYPRATEHIPEMLAMIDELLRAGLAYEAGGQIYFDIAKFPRYGIL